LILLQESFRDDTIIDDKFYTYDWNDMLDSDSADELASDLIEEMMHKIVAEGHKIAAIPYTINKIEIIFNNLINVRHI
jgi:hypothetical protein